MQGVGAAARRWRAWHAPAARALRASPARARSPPNGPLRASAATGVSLRAGLSARACLAYHAAATAPDGVAVVRRHRRGDAPLAAAAPGRRRQSSSSAAPADGVARLLERYGDVPLERIRNFCIIAHIDHGKSTLADALLVAAGNVPPIKSKRDQQVLDSLDVERERGITVKAQTASMLHTDGGGDDYLLNLIDTPGHVDFANEVSRSLAACQGALLLVDCTQGVQAQTIANFHAARRAGLAIVPVLTKVDLPSADPEPSLEQLTQVMGFDVDDVLWTSAKTGEGVDELPEAIIRLIPPPPASTTTAATRCLMFDSWYDEYRGAVCLVQVADGSIGVGDAVRAAHSGRRYSVSEVGLLAPRRCSVPRLGAGSVGYVIAGMKTTREAQVGDTLMSANAADAGVPPLPGFEPSKPMVFASVYPVDSGDFEELNRAVERLILNDASVTVQRESGASLGSGLRCGFLGLLHMEVFLQRLQDEFHTTVVTTAPTVPYTLRLRAPRNAPKPADGAEADADADSRLLRCENPSEFPPAHEVEAYFEPVVVASVVAPQEHLSSVMALLRERRGQQVELLYLEDGRVLLKYQLPWQEVVTDLYDSLKSVSAGYASFDYEPAGEVEADIVKVDVLLNGSVLDALSFVCHRADAAAKGRRVAQRLRTLIARQQYEIVIQAAIAGKVFARERIPPFRKDVLVKSGKTVGGGDVTRKRKLLAKQRKGKARMKTFGRVAIPQAAFHSVLGR